MKITCIENFYEKKNLNWSSYWSSLGISESCHDWTLISLSSRQTFCKKQGALAWVYFQLEEAGFFLFFLKAPGLFINVSLLKLIVILQRWAED